ncbi:hypothetical protein ACHHYP_08503 [Achlya hypogyna]|uniref:HIT domain-containing protein n=1 Tax=Achlya hypogyna TaxID=1202772 RepID=A0A1V9YPH2_ACHHY|nr:hypothetical protein ACHHYP_08503 [Achlya hypogyna]
MRLAQLALERNVRSVLVDLTQGFHAAAWSSIFPALRKSGFKLGVHLPPATLLEECHDFATTEPMSQAAFVKAAAANLAVPTTRALLVQLSTDGLKAQIGLDAATGTQPFASPTLLCTELLGFDRCLEPSWRAFGPYPIRFSEVFYESAHAVALVNLKPIVPGHVLVIPKRRIDRFTHLDSDEVADLWQTAQTIARRIEAHYNAPSFTFSIQDGRAAGQTVPHVHIHLLPRRPGDFAKNDDIYDELEKNDQRRQLDLDEDRVPRTLDVMAAEAAVLRDLCRDP